jgi:hypothetical protein
MLPICSLLAKCKSVQSAINEVRTIEFCLDKKKNEAINKLRSSWLGVVNRIISTKIDDDEWPSFCA